MSFTDKEHCSLVTLHTFKYNVKLCSVYTYKCKLPKTFYSVKSGIYKEILNANEFIYNDNTFKLNDYTYTKEVFTEKNSIGQKEKTVEVNKIDFRYTIDSSGNLTFIDNNSKEKYIGTIKDNKLYIDIKIVFNIINIQRAVNSALIHSTSYKPCDTSLIALYPFLLTRSALLYPYYLLSRKSSLCAR